MMTIQDLSVSVELDRKALAVVRGGAGDQAIATSQSNVQSMVAAANVGNASLFAGPATIQSDNDFTQNATNYNDATNLKAFVVAFPGLVGVPAL